MKFIVICTVGRSGSTLLTGVLNGAGDALAAG